MVRKTIHPRLENEGDQKESLDLRLYGLCALQVAEAVALDAVARWQHLKPGLRFMWFNTFDERDGKFWISFHAACTTDTGLAVLVDNVDVPDNESVRAALYDVERDLLLHDELVNVSELEFRVKR